MAIFPNLSRYRAMASALVRRVERIESGVRAQNRELRRATTLLIRSQIALEALVRRAYLDIEQLPYPERLTAQRFRILSQNAEDGIVLALLREAGVARARFVEIGCGTNGGNSGFLASELGWSGLMIDGSPAALAEARIRFNPERVRFVEALVTRENVNDLLSGNAVENEPDLLSIDIDGNDYWVLEAIEACSPRLLICEYNAAFGPTRSVSVPYDPGSTYASGSAYFGASLSAFTALARRKGYRLVVVEPRGANAFFLRDDVATHVPACEPVDVFRPLVAPRQQFADVLSESAAEKLLGAEKMLEQELIDRGLSLVEIA